MAILQKAYILLRCNHVAIRVWFVYFAANFQEYQQMRSSSRTGSSIFRATLSSCFVVLLLLVYLFGTIQVNSIHSLFHSTEVAELHDSKNENEACHRAIYHNAREGCDHKVHVTANEKCPLCHLIVHTEQWMQDTSLETSVDNTLVLKSSWYQFHFLIFSDHLPARAPPIC